MGEGGKVKLWLGERQGEERFGGRVRTRKHLGREDIAGKKVEAGRMLAAEIWCVRERLEWRNGEERRVQG